MPNAPEGKTVSVNRPKTAGWSARIAGVLVVAALALFGGNALAAPKYAAIVIDAESGAMLHEADADAPRYPASLTKMMTLYLLFEAIDAGRLKMTTKLPVSEYAASQSPTKLGLEEGDLISVREVILGLITKSANDAAVVAAEALAGSEDRFAELMTRRAQRLGMTRTTFRNASGLPDPGQVTTARDLAALSRALIRTFPHHYALFSTAEFAYAGHTYNNHNRMMSWYDGADGIKTGFIRASGFNLAASAVRDGRRLIGVVIGGTSPSARDQKMARLLNAAFSNADAPALPEVRQAAAPAAKPQKTAQNAKAAKTKSTKVAAIKSPAKPVVKGARAPAKPHRTAKIDDEIVDLESGSRDDANWGIQVGAFARSDAAQRAAETAIKIVPRLLEQTAVNLAPLDRKRNPLYRARLIGLSQTEARQACRVLERKNHDCMVVPPSELQAALPTATRVAAN